MGYFGKEEDLKYKYAVIPEEPRQHKAKKSRKKSKAKARSDHKHIYVLTTKPAIYKNTKELTSITDEFCSICGKRRSHYKR